MASSRDILRALKAAGWREVRKRGSHVQLKHPGHARLVTVPHPEKDIPIGTLRAIERASGMRLGS